MRSGVGKVRITPPVGVPILGHLFRISEGIHDDLWAKVMVMEDDEPMAIVGLDLAWPMPEGDYVKIREAIEKTTGIKGERVMVTCTHCHSGPAFQPHPGFPMPLKRQEELIKPWVEELPRRVTEAAEKALSDLRDVSAVRFGKVPITGLTYNRRKRIPEGVASLINVQVKESRYYYGDASEIPHSLRQQYLHWGMPKEQAEELPPSIPDGPIDPDLSVLCFEGDGGKPIAIFTNFACHAVATAPPVPDLISAGFPGVMTDLVEEATGGLCIFTPGASGDIRPYRSKPKGFEEVKRIGLALAAGVLQALREARPVEGPRVKVMSDFVEVALREYPPRDEIKRMLSELEEQFQHARSEGRYAEAKRLLDRINMLDYPVRYMDWVDQKGTVKLEIQAISVGDVVLLSIPNEVNVSIGLELKGKAQTDKLVLLTLANGCYMYLLKEEEYEEGGYEEAACRLAPGSGEKVMDAALKLVERIMSIP